MPSKYKINLANNFNNNNNDENFKNYQSNYELQTLSVENLKVKDLIKNYESIDNQANNNGKSTLTKTQSLEKFSKIKEFAFDNNNDEESYQLQQSMPTIESNQSYFNFKKNFMKNSFNGVMRIESVASSGYGSEFAIDSIQSMPETPVSEERDYENLDIVNSLSRPWSPHFERAESIDELSSESSESIDIVSPQPSDDRTTIDAEATEVKQKKKDYIRIVNRFGGGFKDNCMFPLALPMDGSDVYKGASTWESITLLADCVLKTWEEAAYKNYRILNKVLPNAYKYLFPNNTLEGAMLKHPDCKLPFRRNNSELDLTKIGFNQRRGLIPFGGAGNQNRSRRMSQDDINLNVQIDKKGLKTTRINVEPPKQEQQPPPTRSRAFSSISIRKSSIGSIVRFDKRKDRTGSNLSKKEDKENFQRKRSRAESLIEIEEDKKSKYNAKALIRTIKIESPMSMALQISKIEKELLLNLPSEEIMQLVVKKGRSLPDENASSLKRLIEFGQELGNLVVDIISRESTPESKGKKIAAVIEVGCVLRKLRNWQSLSSWVKGLQSPKVYSMGQAWLVTKRQYSVHFNDYLKLCRIVKQNEVSILRSRQPCLPSLLGLISLMKVRCAATWDRLENYPKWTEPPTLVSWLEKQLMIKSKKKDAVKIEIENEKNKLKSRNLNKSVNQNTKNLPDEECNHGLNGGNLSFIPFNDPVYFIFDNQLPPTWMGRSVRNIPAKFHAKIIRCFHNSYALELSNLDKFFVHV